LTIKPSDDNIDKLSERAERYRKHPEKRWKKGIDTSPERW